MVEHFTKNCENKPGELKKFQEALNKKETPCLKFTHQQRSKLWIVRVFKKLYGKTKTHKVMQSLLNKAQNTNGLFQRFFEKKNNKPRETQKTISSLRLT